MSQTPYNKGVITNVTIITDNGGLTATKDISSLVIEFNIYQSIFENAMTCDVSLLDASGTIFEEIGATGQELIQITFDGRVRYLFRLYKIDKPTPLQEQSYAIILHGVSAAFEKSLNTSIFNTYKGKTGDQIVKEVWNEHIASGSNVKLTTEASDNVLTYTAAGHSPIEFINMVARDTQSSKYPDSSTYLFFENDLGFNFVTLNSLLDKGAVAKFYYADLGTTASNENKNYIAGLTWHHTTDALKGLQNGLFDNTVAAIDPITKTFKEFTFNYSQENNKLTHMRNSGKSLVRPKAFNGQYLGDALKGSSHVRLIETDFNLEIENQTIDGRISEDNDPHKFHSRNTHNFHAARVAQMASLQQHRLDVTCSFDPSVSAGDIVNLYIPNNDGEGSRYNPYFSMYGQRNPEFLVLENIITYDGKNGNLFSTLKTSKESLGNQLSGLPALPKVLDILGNLFQSLTGTPSGKGEETTVNQTQTPEEAAAAVEALKEFNEEIGDGVAYAKLTPLEKQYAIEKGYVDADTYPDEAFG